jgi:hypothetical protein
MEKTQSFSAQGFIQILALRKALITKKPDLFQAKLTFENYSREHQRRLEEYPKRNLQPHPPLHLTSLISQRKKLMTYRLLEHLESGRHCAADCIV